MSEVERRRKKSLVSRIVGNVVLNAIIPHQRRLELVAIGLRLYQWSGLQSAIRKTKVLDALTPSLAELEMSAPTVSKRRFKARGQVIAAEGKGRARVAILVGVRDAADARAGDGRRGACADTERGARWEVTEGQGCCGAIHSHVRDLERARELARKNI